MEFTGCYTSPARAMTFPCPEFMAVAGIQEEFNILCAKEGLTRLADCSVIQYERLTSIFINRFRFYPDDDAVEFRIYDKLLTMPMSRFCEALGLPDKGKKVKMSSQPIELKTLFDSFCSSDTRDLHRQKISNILFPHLRYFTYYIARGVLARDNASNTSSPDTVSWRTPSQGSMSIMWVR